jgi:hypothetical protein
MRLVFYISIFAMRDFYHIQFLSYLNSIQQRVITIYCNQSTYTLLVMYYAIEKCICMLHLAELISSYQPHSARGFKILYFLTVMHTKETF